MRLFEGYYKGVNLGGWLSQCVHTKEHYDSFINENDIRTLSTWGIDHLRLPIDYNLVETEDGEYIESGFDYIQNTINWCGKYGLNLVLDLHKTFGYSFDKGENESGFFDNKDYQERFIKLWEKFASLYGQYSDRVSFELLNEVTDKEYMPTWIEVATDCIKRIRKIAPDVNILIGGYYNNSAESVKDLPMPYDDKIIYNFHCYDPLIFTHQGAPWVDDMDVNFRMKFVDSKVTPLFFEDFFKDALDTAIARDVPLYCGEYGVIDRCDENEAIMWYQALHSIFEKYKIGHAAWSYKVMDFGILERDLIKSEICK